MYLIPANISKKFEFFADFGWKELFITLLPAAFGMVIVLLLGLFCSHPARWLLVIFLGGIGFVAGKPITADGISAIDMLIYLRKFAGSQKLFLYERGPI